MCECCTCVNAHVRVFFVRVYCIVSAHVSVREYTCERAFATDVILI
jgi:hypothetical protein